jgi:hypothetical protein
LAHAEPQELAALAIDPDDVEPDIRAHVASCDECGSRVAMLTGARNAAGEAALVPAPPGVRDRVLVEALGGEVAPLRRSTDVRGSQRARRVAVPLWAAGLAAGVALVAGLGLGQVLVGDDTGSDETVIASTNLTTVEGTAARGVARLLESGSTLTLHVEARDLGDERALREVWLLNVDGTRMVSVGLLPVGEESDFGVPARLFEEGYRIVDISVEPDDGDPTHSGVSVARGELA